MLSTYISIKSCSKRQNLLEVARTAKSYPKRQNGLAQKRDRSTGKWHSFSYPPLKGIKRQFSKSLGEGTGVHHFFLPPFLEKNLSFHQKHRFVRLFLKFGKRSIDKTIQELFSSNSTIVSCKFINLIPG